VPPRALPLAPRALPLAPGALPLALPPGATPVPLLHIVHYCPFASLRRLRIIGLGCLGVGGFLGLQILMVTDAD
jgi:hypothetical protein